MLTPIWLATITSGTGAHAYHIRTDHPKKSGILPLFPGLVRVRQRIYPALTEPDRSDAVLMNNLLIPVS